MAKIVLDATANCAEGGNQDRREYENQEVRQLSKGNVERVERFYKQVVEGNRRQQDRQHSRPVPRVPGDNTDHEQKDRQLWIPELVCLQHKRDANRDGHQNDGKSVAQDRRMDLVKFVIPIYHVQLLPQMATAIWLIIAGFRGNGGSLRCCLSG